MSEKLTSFFSKKSSTPKSRDTENIEVVPSSDTEKATVVVSSPLQSSSNEIEIMIDATSTSASSTQLGPSFLNSNAPSQPRLSMYPKTKFGASERSFSSSWYNNRG